jgi:hypothetical protein
VLIGRKIFQNSKEKHRNRIRHINLAHSFTGLLSCTGRKVFDKVIMGGNIAVNPLVAAGIGTGSVTEPFRKAPGVY